MTCGKWCSLGAEEKREGQGKGSLGGGHIGYLLQESGRGRSEVGTLGKWWRSRNTDYHHTGKHQSCCEKERELSCGKSDSQERKTQRKDHGGIGQGSEKGSKSLSVWLNLGRVWEAVQI